MMLFALAVHAVAAIARAQPPPLMPSVPQDEPGLVHVTVGADAPGVYLEALTEHEGWIHVRRRWHSFDAYARVPRWQPLCLAPCNTRLPLHLLYRVAGPRVPASDEFTLDGGEQALDVRAGSRTGKVAGGVLIVLGIPAAIIGAAIAATTSDPHERTGGFVTLGVGMGMIGGGALLMALSSTNVYDGRGRAIGSARAPLVGGTWLTPSGVAF
jgi:hypothetical protein